MTTLVDLPKIPSLAGTWGSERLEQLQKTSTAAHKTMMDTTSRLAFSNQHINDYEEKQHNKFAKFKTMQAERPVLYEENSPHCGFDGTSSLSQESNNMECERFKLKRTQMKVLRLGDAPVAVGRSGAVPESCVATSGLLGEKLMTSTDPAKNSFAQRSWLYAPDPALLYKVNGIPQASRPEGMSLAIGDDVNTLVAPGWVHGRKAVLTGDPLSKAGAKRAGVFMDEFPA